MATESVAHEKQEKKNELPAIHSESEIECFRVIQGQVDTFIIRIRIYIVYSRTPIKILRTETKLCVKFDREIVFAHYSLT